MKSIFLTKDGKRVIAQKPNAPIILWAALVVISAFPVLADIAEELKMLSHMALFTWGWLELFQGVNTWRKLLGSAVLIYLIVQLFV